MSDPVEAEEVSPEDISSATDAQEKVLALLPFFPALLSIWGSCNICYMVLKDRKHTPYRRILLGMSICDIFSSLVYPWQSFLVPAATSQRVWAIGNGVTCNMMGFLQQCAFSNIWYNGMLSVYFLLTVKFGVRPGVLAKRYEPFMHAISLGYPILTASIGVGMGVYDEIELGAGCWVTNYPKGCGCSGMKTGPCCQSDTIAWIFAGIPTMAIFFMILVNNVLVVCYVWHTIQTSQAGMDRSVRESMQRSSQQRPNHQSERIKAVATQGFLYVAAFLTCSVSTWCLRIMESLSFDAEDEYQLFPLLLIQNLLLPLQGFFNCFIYVRPSFLRSRRDYPHESKYWCFRRALLGEKVSPTGSSTQPSHLKSGSKGHRKTSNDGSTSRTSSNAKANTSAGQAPSLEISPFKVEPLQDDASGKHQREEIISSGGLDSGNVNLDDRDVQK